MRIACQILSLVRQVLRNFGEYCDKFVVFAINSGMSEIPLRDAKSDLLHRCQADSRLAQKPPPRAVIYRRDTTSPLESHLYEPVLCLVLQGTKTMRSGDIEVEVGPGDALVVSHHLPVLSQITQATPAFPYLAVVLTLDMAMTRDLLAQISTLPERGENARAVSCETHDALWFEPLYRYLRMVEDQQALEVLGPAVLREVHYRLLMSRNGAILWDTILRDSHTSRISRAIARMRTDLSTSLKVADLASEVGMSASTFHSHFKAVTGTTPLQYQKDLRLIRSRDLIEGGTHSVSSTAFALGYESPTHFSRDYKRKFGHNPSAARHQS